MADINQEMEHLVEEMREIGKRPAPSKGGSCNNLLKYNELQMQILKKFLDAYDTGYRLKMPTLTQPNEWVNVEERLPEEGESVLCIVNGKPRKNITLCEAYQLGVWYKEDGWLIDEYPEWRDVEVLWWMPLPDAPEGEK